MNSIAQIERKIQPIFEEDGDVAAVFLFGSYASGKNHPHSDIDLAILFEKRLHDYDAYRRREKYFVPLNLALGDKIDVLDVENVNLILLFEIITGGKVLLENNHEKTRAFIARKLLECFDFQYIVDLCARGMHKKTMERQRGKAKHHL